MDLTGGRTGAPARWKVSVGSNGLIGIPAPLSKNAGVKNIVKRLYISIRLPSRGVCTVNHRMKPRLQEYGNSKYRQIFSNSNV